MCTHHPACPSADAPDRDAAHVVASHPADDVGWVVQMDADGSHAPEDLPALLTGARAERADLGRVISHDSFVRIEESPLTVYGPDAMYYSFERLPRGPVPPGLLPADGRFGCGPSPVFAAAGFTMSRLVIDACSGDPAAQRLNSVERA